MGSILAPSAEAEALASSPASSSPDDERALLSRLERLLEREHDLLAARDAAGILAVADERERVTERLGDAARKRRARAFRDAADDADLIERYRRLRQRHEIQAQIVRRHFDQNARAIGVLAQATGQPGLYRADGRLPLQFVSV